MVAWSEEEYEKYKQGEFVKKVKAKQKYGAVAGWHEGKYFRSKGEHERWKELQLLERAGAITKLEWQPKYKLTRAKISYTSDYSYVQAGKKITEDFKGKATDRWKVIKKLWQYYGPNTLRVTKKQGKQIVIVEEIIPGQKKNQKKALLS